MIRKLVLGVLFTGLVGLLIFGAVNRTIAKSETPLAFGLNHENQAENSIAGEDAIAYGIGRGGSGQGRAAQTESTHEGNINTQGSGFARNNNQVDGTGVGQGNGGQGRNSGNENADHTELSALATIEGTVESVAQEALIVIRADGGSTVIEGRAWRFAQEMGYTLQVNEQVRITGFYEDGEFKAVAMSRADGEGAFQFRESSGRPKWAGGGRGGNQN